MLKVPLSWKWFKSLVQHSVLNLVGTSIKYKVECDEQVFRRTVSILYRVRSLALQPLSAGNSAEFSQADNSKLYNLEK